MKYYLLPLFLLFFACSNPAEKETIGEEMEPAVLSFIAAGHTYGNSDTFTESNLSAISEENKGVY